GIESIIVDMPGTGGSATPLLPLRLSGLARLCDRLLGVLGYREVDVLGISWGGALAQEVARRYPARVGKLVLAATSCGWLRPPGRPGGARGAGKAAPLLLAHLLRERRPHPLWRGGARRAEPPARSGTPALHPAARGAGLPLAAHSDPRLVEPAVAAPPAHADA